MPWFLSFFSRERLIQIGAAIAFAVAGGAIGMKTADVKDAACGAPAIEKVEAKK